MGCTLAELDKRMSAAEFTKWQAYWQLEPWGAWRDNWHSAIISALIYNTNRGKQPSVKASEFMYRDIDTDRAGMAKKFATWLKARARPKKDG